VGTIAITGSASGIGAATRALVEARGDTVIGIDLHDAEVTADLGLAEERERAVAETSERAGGVLDGLVTCAGVGPPFDAEKMLTINWFGTEAFLSGLRPALAASNGVAKVVAVSSNSTTLTPNLPDALIDACLAMDEAAAHEVLAGLTEPIDMTSAYGGSKTAVARYVRRNAPSEDWAGSGIRLNAIAPGAVMTPLLQGGLDDENFGAAIAMMPIATDFGSPEVIAEWIAMMLSPAADFMCGSVVFVDGGSDAILRADDWPATFVIPGLES
jgi:NAD(P)-dependent dehydrogenase (short-subunit alcohol dehydrogenase family)